MSTVVSVSISLSGGLALAEPAAPMILLEVGGDSDQAPETGDEASASVLFMNGLARWESSELARALERLAADLKRRRNPLYTPLDDEELRAETEAILAVSRPALTAATALGAGSWRSGDGDLTARVVAHCGRTTRCRALAAGAPDDELQRRLRFLVWPIGYAIVVHPSDGAAALQIAELLRGRETGESRLALVLTAAELHGLRRAADIGALAREATRVLALAQGASPPLRRLLSGLAHASSSPDEVPWLRLPTGSILIVPRLSTLATPNAFLTEVRTRLVGRAVSVAWLTAGTTAPGR